jgi:protein-S-isoprenylcysteine O-methyltransferase Ste14
MLWRSVIAFLALPGLVAFAIPVLWLSFQGDSAPKYAIGALVFVVGLFGLLWCVRDFYVKGKGTLAPWSPPSELVVVGLYRYTRNPMYVSVLLLVLSWSVLFGSLALLGYAVALGVVFHLRVIFGEEPWLVQRYGAKWEDYKHRVPRWLGVLKPRG